MSQQETAFDPEEAERQHRARRIAATKIFETPLDPATIGIEPLAGMTNRNYLVSAGGKRYVVRIPGAGTEEYIDRKADEEAGRLTSEIGVNAPLIWYDPATGAQVTRFIDGAEPMSPRIFAAPKAVEQAALAFPREREAQGEAFLIETADGPADIGGGDAFDEIGRELGGEMGLQGADRADRHAGPGGEEDVRNAG